MDQVIISDETCKTACRALSFMIADLSQVKQTSDSSGIRQAAFDQVITEEIETCKRALALASRAVPVSPAQMVADDLLDALKDMTQLYEFDVSSTHPSLLAARDVIAKAEPTTPPTS